MENEEWKVSVWICQEEKMVSGLTRRTTCADVVRVLLEDHNEKQAEEGSMLLGEEASMLLGPPQCYCIVEKWRGFERILPNKTKILRLWTAWGEEQDNVRFVLVRSEASLPNIGPRSAEAKVVLSKESPCHQRTLSKTSTGPTQDKQRRVVRKAFRKLAKINRKRHETLPKESSSVEKMETLVHLVLSQDHTIRQQVQRIMELDREIERFGARTHFDRMKVHGVNYVQETYLLGTASDKGSASDSDPPIDQSSQEELLADYAQKCDKVLLLQEQISRQEEAMEQITVQIQEELNKRWMERRQEELSSKEQESSLSDSGAEQGGDESQLLLEQERVKTELSASLYIGLRLNTDLEAIKADLDYTQKMWDDKEQELQSLLHSLNDLETPGCQDLAEISCEDTSLGVTTTGSPTDSWVEKDLGRPTNCEANDEDSDTGLSSMHSQDSDSGPVCESLV